MGNARNLGSLLNTSATIQADDLNIGQLSNRNLIINGAMQVWQRGTSRVFSAANYVSADRYQPGQFQGAGYERVAVSGTGPTAQYALRVSSSSSSEAGSGTRMSLGQMIESVNCQRVKGQQVTLSFWIKFSNATFTNYNDFLCSIWEYDAADPSFGSTGPTRSTVLNLTNGSLPTSWTKYTITATINSAANTLAARFSFLSLVNTTNNSDLYYDITEIQLEAGTGATPFEHRSFGQELALCQRYFQVLDYIPAVGVNSTTVKAMGSFPVTMRATPTIGATGVLNWQGEGASNTTQSSVNIFSNFSSNTGFNVSFGNFSSVTQGRTLNIAVPANNSNRITLDAEL